MMLSLSARRAWIETTCIVSKKYPVMSLSARRAWIETNSLDDILAGVNVALRKESVDRNKLQRSIDTISQPSLSARRAWIETE